jgi:hypothetical protein
MFNLDGLPARGGGRLHLVPGTGGLWVFIFIRLTPLAWAVLVPIGLGVLALIVLGLALAAPGAINRLREQYRRRGLVALGTVQKVSPHEGSGWHIRYCFSDLNGRQYRSFAEFPEEEKPAVGDPLEIVYLPENPHFSDIAATGWTPRRSSRVE